MTRKPTDIGAQVIADMHAAQLEKLSAGVSALRSTLHHVDDADRPAADAVLTLLSNNLGDVVAYLHAQAAANIANVLVKAGASGDLLNPNAFANTAVAEHQKAILNTQYEELLVRRALEAGDHVLNPQLNENAVPFQTDDDFSARFNPEKEDRAAVPTEPEAAMTVILQHLNDNLHGIARTPFGAGFFAALEKQAAGYNSETGKAARGHGGKDPTRDMSEDQLLRNIFLWAGWAYVACGASSKALALEGVIAYLHLHMPHQRPFLATLDPSKLRTRLREKEGDALKGQRASEYNKLFTLGERFGVWLTDPKLADEPQADGVAKARARAKNTPER